MLGVCVCFLVLQGKCRNSQSKCHVTQHPIQREPQHDERVIVPAQQGIR